MKFKSHITIFIATAFMILLPVGARADQLLYDNGAINGFSNAYLVSSSQSVSDSFSISGDSTLHSFTLGLWVLQGESIYSLDWSITTGAFSGTTLASGTASPYGNVYFINNNGTFSVLSAQFALTSTALVSGTYWLQISNATTAQHNNVYWDINYGSSAAYRVSSGITNSMPSSPFQIYGTTAVPEPSTYALFGIGALVMVFAYRRKVA